MNLKIFSFVLYFTYALATQATAPVPQKNCTTSECHTDIRNFKKLHGPNKAKGCTVCHALDREGKTNSQLRLPKAHPLFIKILPKEINESCLGCHEDKNSSKFKFTHKATTEKTCISCHDPHGSNNKHLLKIAPLSELCISCHKEVKDEDHGAHNSILTQNKSCSNCHESHFSHEEKLLKVKPEILCLQCHNKEIVTSNKQTLINIKKLIETSPNQHKPVEEGKCQSCHFSHGSRDRNFLKKVYSNTDPELCIECHKHVNTDPRTIDATAFRNGNVNLHYYHLNDVKKLLSCQTCHEVHASTQALLIRSTADYNNWKLPIEFHKNPDGGACLTACHKDKTYSRTNPFSNEAGR